MTTTTTTSKQSRIGRLDRFESNRLTGFAEDDSAVVRAASLLVGLELRGWLSRREIEYLDSLAPDNALTFLVHGNRYLHPNDLPLFPLDLIDAAVNQGGDAVFSHRCESDCTCTPGVCRVFTGVIDDAHGEPLVLGMFGPDSPTEKVILADRFEQVISAFRKGRESVNQALAALGSTPPGAARIIVNRASGRIIHVDNAICTAVNRESSDFISREYSTVEPLIERLVRKFKMKLENLACGCLHISCLTFQPSHETTPADSNSSTDLLESLTGSLADLTTVAEYLDGNAGFLSRAEIMNLTAEIARTGQRLTRRLRCLRTAANFEQFEATRINLLHQLDCAIDRVTDPRTDSVTLTLDSDCENSTVVAPPDALRLLFETILETHSTPDTTAPTTVRMRQSRNQPGAEITFTTTVPDSARLADLERVWSPDAEQLARLLGIPVQRRLLTESNTVVTTLNIRAQENPA